MELELDKWQRDVLATSGNICLCSGRQVGKSTVIAMKAGESAMSHNKKSIMVIAATERQALLLFEKILSYIYIKDKKIIKTGKDRPTKHELKLKNGSIIRCLPTGDSGYGIRGYTIDELYADEAHFIPEDVWAAVTPMLATTGGTITLLSTPFGTEGYFFRCFNDKKFTSFHVSTEDVAKRRQDPQRTFMLEFLKDEKLRMTKLQYQQEYLGLFVGGILRFFENDLIEKVCSIDSGQRINTGNCYQGIDIARLGGDETVLVSGEILPRGEMRQFDMTIPEGQRLTDTARLIIHKDKQINHEKIGIDDGGLGVGVYDILFEDDQTKRKIVGINNAKREIDKERGKDLNRKVPLLKETLYINTKTLMEQNKLLLLNDPKVKQSLRSILCDYSTGELRIYGNYSHIAEAINRMTYFLRNKDLNIYFYN